MEKSFQLGCHRLTFHERENISIDREFELIKECGVFDYVDWLPRPDIVDKCLRASQKHDLPMLTGTYGYILGRDEESLRTDMTNAAGIGIKVHNIMIGLRAADGHELTNAEVVECYLRCYELGEKLGVTPSFEVHVDMWSEQFLRVQEVAEEVRSRGVPFWFTLDYSHCIYKMENPAEQEVSKIREGVTAGEVILDPFEPGNFCDKWLGMNMVVFAQFRPVSPNGPHNIWASAENGKPGRGIQYPFLRPNPGEFHSPWSAYRLEPSKEAIRKVLRYHAIHPDSPLRFLNTEMISNADYGQNAGYSIFENNIACAKWIRETWATIREAHVFESSAAPELA